jgi:cell wall-associated NlpC family hydrolase
MPRTAAEQFAWARPIHHRQLHRGDLMFFHRHGRVYHVGIFLRWKHGRAVMLDARKPGTRVQRGRPWTWHYWAATLRRTAHHHQRR